MYVQSKANLYIFSGTGGVQLIKVGENTRYEHLHTYMYTYCKLEM